MNIEFKDFGTVASVTITSTVFEFRKHNRVVDTTLFLVPEVISEHRGFFFLKAVLSGKNRHALRAYRIALQEIGK